MNPLSIYPEVAPRCVILTLSALCSLYIISYLTFHLKYFFFPRKEQISERYPFESTLIVLSNESRLLEAIWDFFKAVKEKTNKKTYVVNTIGVNHLVFTNDVENVTYILKTNYTNFGKAGSAFKPKFQGLLGDGIFNSDGHQWYAHRKTSALIFRLNRFKTSVLQVFNEDIDQCISWIRERKEQSFDMHFLMHRCTLESIARIAFGIHLGVIFNARVPFAEDFDYCTWSINQSMSNPLWLFARYFTPAGWKYWFSLWRINTFSKKIIQERRAKFAKGEGVGGMNDLLSLYLDKGTFTENDELSSPTGADTFLEPNDSTLRDVILNMVIAGRDTTAQALSWAFYRLVLEPGMQDRVYAEISSVARTAPISPQKHLSYEQLQEMKLLEAFCLEVLRLHPSVPKEAKCVFKDDILPDGTPVYQGDIVSFVPWVMGRDPDLWGQDAERFRPERFVDKPKPSPFVFTAFQAGPRTCLGQNFAMLEMKCVLARLVLMFEFSFAQDPKSITYENSLTLPMKGGMQLKAKNRV